MGNTALLPSFDRDTKQKFSLSLIASFRRTNTDRFDTTPDGIQAHSIPRLVSGRDGGKGIRRIRQARS